MKSSLEMATTEAGNNVPVIETGNDHIGEVVPHAASPIEPERPNAASETRGPRTVSRRIKREHPDMAKALAFVLLVKKRYRTDPERYKSFFNILRDHRTKRITRRQAIDRVISLFHDQPYLVLRFRKFLPSGFCIKAVFTVETPPDAQAQPGAQAQTQALVLPHRPKSAGERTTEGNVKAESSTDADLNSGNENPMPGDQSDGSLKIEDMDTI